MDSRGAHAVKFENCIVNHVMSELDISCFPADLPEYIEVDCSALKKGMLISHDLAVVQHLCDDVAVLREGRIVEQGPPERLFTDAQHPYTRALLEAVPQAEPPE